MINKLWNIMLAAIGVSLATSIMVSVFGLPMYTAIYGAVTMLGGYVICMLVNLNKEEK